MPHRQITPHVQCQSAPVKPKLWPAVQAASLNHSIEHYSHYCWPSVTAIKPNTIVLNQGHIRTALHVP